MELKNNPYTLDRVVRMVITALTLLGILFLLKYLSPVLTPFFIALFIVYLINPLVNYFQRIFRLKKRIIAVLLTFITLGGLISVIVAWIVPVFVSEMIRMAQLTKSYIQIAGYKNFLPGDMDLYLKDFLEEYQIQDLFDPRTLLPILQKSLAPIQDLLSGSWQMLTTVIGVFIIVLYVIFLLIDFDKLEKNWSSFVPEKYRKLSVGIVDDMKDGMNKYFRLQGLIALIVGVLLAVGFSIIGLPMAIIIGLFIGMLNLVPYLQIAGVIPALLLALLKALETGNSFWHEALLVLIVVGIVQTIQDVVLTPRIMGKAYGMNPAIILLVLSIWGMLLGFIGLLLALPLTTIIISYYKRFILNHESLF